MAELRMPLDMFGALYREHYRFVWNAVRRFGVPDLQADDAVQDAFLTAYVRRHDFDGRRPRAWLYGIARRTASNHRRSGYRHRRRLDAVEHARAIKPQPSDADAGLALLGLERFLGTLSVRDRELFVLSELEGLDGRELTAALGVNRNTAYDRLRTLRRRFRAALSEDAASQSIAHARKRGRVASAVSWAVLKPKLASVGAPRLVSGSLWLLLKSTALSTAAAAVVLGAIGALAPAFGNQSAAPGAPLRSLSSRDSEAVANVGPTEAPAETALPSRPAVSQPIIVAARTRREAATQHRVPAVAASVPVHTPPPPTPNIEPPPTPTSSSPSIAADTALLRRAAAALKTNSLNVALSLADEHARDFPDSALADARGAIRIQSLCGLGKHVLAQREAQAFIEERPSSPLVPRVRAACAATSL